MKFMVWKMGVNFRRKRGSGGVGRRMRSTIPPLDELANHAESMSHYGGL